MQERAMWRLSRRVGPAQAIQNMGTRIFDNLTISQARQGEASRLLGICGVMVHAEDPGSNQCLISYHANNYKNPSHSNAAVPVMMTSPSGTPSFAHSVLLICNA